MRKWPVILAVTTVLLAAAAFGLSRVPDLARIGVGYAAEQTCACLFISGRSLESCRRDLEPTARLIPLKPGAGEVTARIFGLARATARYTAGFGCSLRE